jgi:hypothetical protein
MSIKTLDQQVKPKVLDVNKMIINKIRKRQSGLPSLSKLPTFKVKTEAESFAHQSSADIKADDIDRELRTTFQ